MPKLIHTPYGPKTPHLLTRAMDAHVREKGLVDALIDIADHAMAAQGPLSADALARIANAALIAAGKRSPR